NGRHSEGEGEGGRRGPGIDLPARVVARRYAVLRIRQDRVVEPLQEEGGREGGVTPPHGGRVRRASVGLPRATLRLRRLELNRLHLRGERDFAPGEAEHCDREAGGGPDALH